MNRQTSRVMFAFGVATAAAITCIVLYSLMARLSGFETLFLLIGSLVVLWAILFTFYEVRRIATRSKSIRGEVHEIDPDGPRRVIIQPPTGDPWPHHEYAPESPGQDQGQLTSRLSGTPSIRELFRRQNRK